MRKLFFYAAIAGVAFASCAKDNDGIVAPHENEKKVAIQFAMGNGIEVTTRGTGAVGDTLNGANEWASEKLHVFMFEKGTMNLAQDPNNDNNYFFNNAVITAPGNGSEGTAVYDGVTKYYPGNGNFDFFAYHADDAIDSAIEENDDAFTVDIKIDGTQDIMVAKAAMNAAEKAHYVANSNDPDCNRVYSAYSARRDAHPRFQFTHELSRLVFYAIDMAEEDFNKYDAEGQFVGIQIDSVKIFNTKTIGTMTVAATDASKLGVAWNESVSTLTLEERTASGEETSTMVPVKVDADTVRLGESMLIAPGTGDNVRELVVYYTERPNGVLIKNEYQVALNNNFEKGSQYNVFFKVYNNEEIKLHVELTAWKDGGDIEVDSEAEE